eukprot:TRINITY_DN925_c1_g1_i1.p1 TRINITY_DN925_c1_g1~~TRINITY_DN925_c1_g1_i1.p1  ORF type:complete len:458 (-),score=129.19 TRINITY_DN925_c1_g1_i1:38-1411(-)
MPKRKKYSGAVELKVEIIKARDLAAMDRGGTSDPYCVVFNTFNKQKYKTSCIKKTLNPTWNSEFIFFISEPTEGYIFVKLWDKDRWARDDFLGEVAINLRGLERGEPLDDWYHLENEPKKKAKSGNTAPGQVQIKISCPTLEEKLRNSGPVATGNATNDEESGGKSFSECYTLSNELGRGGFSIVRKGIKNGTNEEFAIKIIEMNTNEDEIELLRREIDIMQRLEHPNIIKLLDVFEEDDYMYLVLELVTGGELFDHIISRGTYSERDAANIVRQILEAVAYIHDLGIAHRDLKPENLLVSGPNNDVIKVTDFGLSKDTAGGDRLQTSCGTPDYVAPEVLMGKEYDETVDVWSVGVICYILLCGFPPFYGNHDQQIFEKILKCDYDFPSPDWDSISAEAKQFIQAVLVLDARRRPSAAQCLQAPWIKDKAPTRAIERIESFRLGMEDHVAKRRAART